MAKRKRRDAPPSTAGAAEQPRAPGAALEADRADSGRSAGARLRDLLARPWVALAIPLLLAVLAYARVLDGEFQFDDQTSIERNLAVKDLGALVRNGLTGQFTPRPVTDLTFALNYAVGGLEPWNFHATNVLIHLVAVVLVFLFTRAVLRLAGAARGEWVAVAVAGVFALHPIQSEAVAYIVQRAESLASALYLASLLLILAAERRGLTARGAPLWVAAFCCYLAGLGAKAIVVTMPAAWLLLVAAVPAREGRSGLLSWRRRALVFAPFVVIDVVLARLALGGTEGSTHAGFSIPGLPPSTYFLTQLRVLLVYLRLLFWPSGQTVDWDFPLSRDLDASVVLSGSFLLVLAGAAVWAAVAMRRRAGAGAAAARVASYGVLWFFLVLSVTSSFVPLVDVLVEHRLYLASWGIFVAVAVGAERALARIPPRNAAVAAAAVVALTWATPAAALYRRNEVWESRRALWEDAVAKSPLKARVHMGLGYELMLAGELEASARANTVALGLARGDAAMEKQIVRNLGATYVRLHRFDEAEDVLRAGAARLVDGEILNNLAVTLIAKGKLDEAEAVAHQATEAAPDSVTPWTVLGEIELRRGQPAKALPLFERAFQLDPDRPGPSYNRGRALAALGRVDDACAVWRAIDAGGDVQLRKDVRREWERNCVARR